MSEKNNELLPCPFCGSKSWNRDELGVIWFYHKKNCWIDPLNDGIRMSDPIDRTRWNRRAARSAGKGK